MVNGVMRRISLFLALGAVSLFAQTTIDSALTAYWPFERTAPFSTNDESPNHFDLVGIQGVANAHILPNGPYGNYLSFDSIGSCAVAKESMGAFNAKNFTFAAFVQLRAPGKLQTLFQNSAAVAGKISGYQIQITPWNGLQVLFGDSTSGQWRIVTAQVFQIVGRSHIAVTCDKGNISIFINGHLQPPSTYFPGFTPGTSFAIFGGALIDGQYSNLFKDQIDEIRVYSRALSASEIATLANPPKQDVSGCWDVEQYGPDKTYTGTMSLSQASDGSVSGTITWDSPYPTTTVAGTVQGNLFSVTGSWTTPSVVTVTYSGTLTTYGTVILNAFSKDNGGRQNGFHAVKKVCVVPPPPPPATTQCWSVRQEKGVGSGTLWTGLLQINIDGNGAISGGTITWDVPSNGTVTGGSITGNSVSVSTHNITYNMDVTYTGTLSADGNSIINGKSDGTYAFDGTKTVCP